MEEKETDSKEVSDALHMLLHCSLKDTEFETQKEQFEIVNAYIKQLEEENKELKKVKTDGFILNNPWLLKYLNEVYIFKGKVKEKMKKYEWSLNGYDSSTADYKHSQCIGRYLALQELLREE